MQRTFLTIAATLAYTQLANAIAVKSPVARGDDTMCAQVGWDTTTESYWSSTDANYPACSALCFSQSQCKSFGFGDGQCYLYDVPVYPNIYSQGFSPYTFYDLACEQEYVSCAQPGYDYNFRTYDYSNDGTYDTCVKKCTSQSNCKSYAYGNGECFLYDVPVSGNLNPKSSSPYLFYDKKCAPTTNSTTTTTSKTTSTTTTKASTTTTTSKHTSSSTSKPTSTSKTSSTTTISTKQSTSTATKQSTTSMSTASSSSQTPSTTPTTTSKPNLTTSTTTKPSGTTTTSNTAAATVTTTVTISNQPYICTAMGGLRR